MVIVAGNVAAHASLVNAIGCSVCCGGRCDARVMWLRVCCLRCAMTVVCRRRGCDDEDGVVALSVTVYVVCAMCCARDDDNDDDATMADDSM